MTSSRDTQDIILRALCDGPFRRNLCEDGSVEGVSLDFGQRIDHAGLDRFARFLTRHYYRERIVHFFKYSRALAPLTGHKPEDVLKMEAFKKLAPVAVIGSYETASSVVSLLRHYLLDNSDDVVKIVPYWHDLVRYECAFFLADAKDSSARSTSSKFPVRTGRAELLNLEWDIASILPALLTGFDSLPIPNRAFTRLLICRSQQGRVSVVRCTEAIVLMLENMDGRRDITSIAQLAGLETNVAEKIISRLVEIGAVDCVVPFKHD